MSISSFPSFIFHSIISEALGSCCFIQRKYRYLGLFYQCKSLLLVAVLSSLLTLSLSHTHSHQTIVKSFNTGTDPLRCAKFIIRKQWIAACSDDMKIFIYNYNTMDKVKEWVAHTDYIRYLEVHPTRPYILSSSDDMSIKLWDWEHNFDCIQTFEGHSHYVMMVKINPIDTNTFASASVDKTIKVWGLMQRTPHCSLSDNGTFGSHTKIVNCIDYYPNSNKPYLLSGSDDCTVKIWDYQMKAW